MKVMFVYSLEDVQGLSRPLRSWTAIQFGISYLSSTLKAEGHQTQLVVLGSNSHWQHHTKQLNHFVSEFSPQLICFTAVATQYPFIRKVAGLIRSRWPDKYLIIGGVHATLNPSAVIQDAFDAVCVGEGEYPLSELCRQLEANTRPQGIRNLWIKSSDGTVETNPPRPFLQDIDRLPFPDRKIWVPWMKQQLGDEFSVLAGRGCPYNCTYCCNHALKKIAAGAYVRLRSPEKIIEEIAFIHAAHPDQSRIYFEVESIAVDKSWLFEFCRQLEAFNGTIGNSMSYGCNYRISPQAVDENIFAALKKAGFTRINIGLESGSEQIRRDVLKRDYSNKDFLEVTAMARKVGLKVFVFNMIGLPGETRDTYMETVSLNRQCQPDMHYTGIFFPYPGTKLYETCVQSGVIEGPLDYRLERKRATLDFPQFSKRQIQRAYTEFDYRVYKGHKPFWWVIGRTVLRMIHSNITLNNWFRQFVQWPGCNYLREKLARI